MRHTILELVQEAVFHKFRRLEGNPVDQSGIICESYLFIEFFFTYPGLSLEGIES